VTIPSSVTTIGDDAFWGCTSLTSVTIPRFCKIYGTSFPETCSVIRRNQSVLSWFRQLCWRSIKKNAKQDAIFLAITIVLVIIGIISSCDSALNAAKDQGMVFDDDDIAVIGVESSKRDSLEKAVIPEDIRVIGKSAFAECHNLTSVVIPDSVEVIGSGAFRNSPNLKKVQIPSSVTAIGEYAFQNCHSLESVTIPDGVKVIAKGVFQNCRNLTEMRTPAGVGGIMPHAFAGCSNLKNVQISFGTSVIAYEAFQNCRNLESVFIPDSVQLIGYQAFAGCSKLKHVTIPRNCQRGHAAFPDGCTVTRR